MKILATILATAAILSITPLAHADPVALGNSGWLADLPDNVNVGVTVDSEGPHFVVIEIVKTFTAPPIDGLFPPISIDFTQASCDSNTVALIALTDETVTNNTGFDWTDYHWSIEGPAAFMIAPTVASGFSTAPFINMDWVQKTGWDAGYASALNVDGGLVPSGSAFYPGLDAGKLYVKVDLCQDESGFTLTQNPTPEPTTMLLLAAGLPLLLRRRRKLKAALRA